MAATQQALQTSGVIFWTWIPPRGRFVSYDSRDETWLKYFGLGENKEVPAELYDVRLPDGELVGYSAMNPNNCRGSRLRFAIAEPVRYEQRSSSYSYIPPQKVTEVEVLVSWHRISTTEGSQDFSYWSVNPSDAIKLLESGWVKVIGRDNIHSKIRQIQNNQYRKGRGGI